MEHSSAQMHKQYAGCGVLKCIPGKGSHKDFDHSRITSGSTSSKTFFTSCKDQCQNRCQSNSDFIMCSVRPLALLFSRHAEVSCLLTGYEEKAL